MIVSILLNLTLYLAGSSLQIDLLTARLHTVVSFGPDVQLAEVTSLQELHPSLDHLSLGQFLPDLEKLREENTIDNEQYAQCLVLRDQYGTTYDVRYEAAMRLQEHAQYDEFPYDLRRWIVFNRVLLAGSLNKPDELETVAMSWLKNCLHKDELEKRAPKEDMELLRAELLLRGYLVHVYSSVFSEAFYWSTAYRMERVRELMQPLLENPNFETRDELLFALFYVKQLRALSNRHSINSRRNIQEISAIKAFDKEDAARQAKLDEDLNNLLKTIIDSAPKNDSMRSLLETQIK